MSIESKEASRLWCADVTAKQFAGAYHGISCGNVQAEAVRDAAMEDRKP